MLLRASTEARHKGRSKIATRALEKITERLSSNNGDRAQASYKLTARECKLITPIKKRNPEQVIPDRIQQLRSSLEYGLMQRGIKATCYDVSELDSHRTDSSIRLKKCLIIVVRTDF